MPRTLSKSGLVSRLAEQTGLTKQKVTLLLDNLTDLACREAANGGFTLPNLCKFKLVRRPSSRRFNPATRRHYLIAEHDVLKIVPLKKARDIIAPLPPELITPLPAPNPAPAAEAAPAPAPDSAPAPSPQTSDATAPADETGGVIFNCPHCNNTIMAQPQDRGKAGECPACSAQIVIPDHAAAAPASAGRQEPAGKRQISDFVTFICEACHQEIEAPLEMIGLEAACPACGSSLHVPAHETAPARDIAAMAETGTAGGAERSSMTIRMDLSDFTG